MREGWSEGEKKEETVEERRIRNEGGKEGWSEGGKGRDG